MSDGLVVHSTLKVVTEEREHEIQLCFGDITKLPMEDKVDYIMVSAFQGDYAATRTSLIGALQHNLGLSVRDLAKNKKEDLRQHFHCWQSHPLPENMPYRQLVCFETPLWSGFRHPAELVGDVFRALIPMFQNQEKSVITPLLATGDQNFSRSLMLKSMLDAAVSWIRAGLPLKCLKIVLFKRDPSWLSSDENKLCDIFSMYKKHIQKVTEEEKANPPEDKYDVYFSYNKDDKDRVMQISKLMQEEYGNLKVWDEEQSVNNEVAFQDDILKTMRQSHRVVTFLSPAFLNSPDCVEKYNLALCVNRKSRKNILAPFYVETITTMPTYMTLVQYVDVRNRDGTDQRLVTGVHTFIATLVVDVSSMTRPMSNHYDVFISYSHRNAENATQLMNELRRLDPQLRVFFDRTELKTGYSWQQTLYHGIDNSKVLVALISPDYLSSQVCTEEYNLALCRHLTESPRERLHLIPVKIAPCDSMPAHFTRVSVVDGVDDFKHTANRVSSEVVNFIKSKSHPVQVVQIDLKGVLSSHRAKTFHERFTIKHRDITHNHLDYSQLSEEVKNFKDSSQYQRKLDDLAKIEEEVAEVKRRTAVQNERDPADYDGSFERQARPQLTEDPDKVYDVAFVCADHLHGEFLNTLLFLRAPQLDTNWYIKSENAEVAALEKARLCVVLISAKLVSIGKDVDELDIALARQRKNPSKKLIYPIQIGNLPSRPSYCHLMPYDVSLGDAWWIQVMSDSQMTSDLPGVLPDDIREVLHKVRTRYKHCNLSLGDMIALSTACDDIISLLLSKKSDELKEKHEIITNIVSLAMEQSSCVVKKKVAVEEEKQTDIVLNTTDKESPEGCLRTTSPGPPPSPPTDLLKELEANNQVVSDKGASDQQNPKKEQQKLTNGNEKNSTQEKPTSQEKPTAQGKRAEEPGQKPKKGKSSTCVIC